LDDHILSFPQGGNRLLLPEVGHGDLVERRQLGKWRVECAHKQDDQVSNA
jgi:hypothetical protein